MPTQVTQLEAEVQVAHGETQGRQVASLIPSQVELSKYWPEGHEVLHAEQEVVGGAGAGWGVRTKKKLGIQRVQAVLVAAVQVLQSVTIQFAHRASTLCEVPPS